jgi:hypothetical protein
MSVKTIRTPTVGGVTVKATQHVHYFLQAKGAVPVFNQACKHGVLLNQDGFEVPRKMNYEWVLQRSPAEPVSGLGPDVPAISMDADDEDHGIAMSYFTAESYTLRVEHHDSNHTKILTLSDVDYEKDEIGDFTGFEVSR